MVFQEKEKIMGVFVWTVLLLVFSGAVRGHRLLGSVNTGSNRRNSFSKSRMSPQDSIRVHKFMNRKEAVKMYAVRLKQTQESLQSDMPAPAPVQKAPAKGRIIHVNDYGADPTGAEDNTEALMAAISDAFSLSTEGHLMPGVADLRGAEIHLQGGNYRLSAPLQMPRTGGGNIVGKVPLLFIEGMHQIHMFVLELVIVHVVYCAMTMILGAAKIHSWKRWEVEIKKNLMSECGACKL